MNLLVGFGLQCRSFGILLLFLIGFVPILSILVSEAGLGFAGLEIDKNGTVIHLQRIKKAENLRTVIVPDFFTA